MKQISLLNNFEENCLKQLINYSDMDTAYKIYDEVESDIKRIFTDLSFDIKQAEGLYILTAGRMQYLLNWFLKHSSFSEVKDLKDAYLLIVKYYLMNEKMPDDKFKYYLNLCNYTVNIVGMYNEETSDCSYDSYLELQQKWTSEHKIMSNHERIIANLDYIVFELLNGFIRSFYSNENVQFTLSLDNYINQYINLIQEILVSILWTFQGDMIEIGENQTDVPVMIAEIKRIKEDIYFIYKGFSVNEFKSRADFFTSLNILI